MAPAKPVRPADMQVQQVDARVMIVLWDMKPLLIALAVTSVLRASILLMVRHVNLANLGTPRVKRAPRLACLVLLVSVIPPIRPFVPHVPRDHHPNQERSVRLVDQEKYPLWVAPAALVLLDLVTLVQRILAILVLRVPVLWKVVCARGVPKARSPKRVSSANPARRVTNPIRCKLVVWPVLKVPILCVGRLVRLVLRVK